MAAADATTIFMNEPKHSFINAAAGHSPTTATCASPIPLSYKKYGHCMTEPTTVSVNCSLPVN